MCEVSMLTYQSAYGTSRATSIRIWNRIPHGSDIKSLFYNQSFEMGVVENCNAGTLAFIVSVCCKASLGRMLAMIEFSLC